MPYMDLKTSTTVSAEQQKALFHRLGEAISLLPGKSEQWLMLSLTDRCRMAFRGSEEPPVAMLEVKLFGRAAPEDYDALTRAATDILAQELSLLPERIYVRYEETEHWGFAGENF